MKVQELRQMMELADMEHLMKAFIESYKLLKKAQKEEIDPVIADILKGNTVAKKKTEEIVVEFEDLEQQIEEFIKNARAQNYIAPNRVIPKNQGRLKGLKKYDSGRYRVECDIDELCDLFLMLSAALAEPIKGVEYYLAYYKGENQERALYHALSFIDNIKEDELWMQVYEYGIKHNIKLSDSMQTKYEKRKNQNS
ncbi:MAG: hypothetical protein K2L86_02925 [Lachnospiraceae bacterium]|nr:hypothetical protein [Lachnospiraceae bacterium]